MPPALFTTGQSRWALQGAVTGLSLVAVFSGWTASAGDEYLTGDISGPMILLGALGATGVVLLYVLSSSKHALLSFQARMSMLKVRRTTSLLVPTPWRIYLDRLEFTFVSMLWICWTSLTLSFSAFTLAMTTCAAHLESYHLPRCPLLAFDLVLLYLLSIVSLAHVLVIVSTALSPGYAESLSPALGEAHRAEEGSVFVMWDLALGSSGSSRVPSPGFERAAGTGMGYGTLEETGRPGRSLIGIGSPAQSSNGSARTAGKHRAEGLPFPKPSNPYATEGSVEVIPTSEPSPPTRKDKFAEGRLWTYIPLLLCSFSVAGAAAWVIDLQIFVPISIFLIVVALLSAAFAATFVYVHHSQRLTKISDSEQRSYFLRHDRALEVGAAAALFLLWPLAAVMYTILPASPDGRCSDAASSYKPDPADDPSDWNWSPTVCTLTSAIVLLSWLAAWIVFARVLGLVFPMPEVGEKGPTIAVLGRTSAYAGGEEGQSLLRSGLSGEDVGPRLDSRQAGTSPTSPARPQVKWGRMVAGEAFELLGEDEDEE